MVKVMSAVSMLGVDPAYRIGRCGHSIPAGLFSASIAAVWAEIVYLSPHIVAEMLQPTGSPIARVNMSSRGVSRAERAMRISA
ncbi:hypothetical protein WP12_12955 [Sphingomonas sp. SRS2]|nr:hypothetical protein WP12_12955 [Sphingomonas sp. SRS2]